MNNSNCKKKYCLIYAPNVSLISGTFVRKDPKTGKGILCRILDIDYDNSQLNKDILMVEYEILNDICDLLD